MLDLIIDPCQLWEKNMIEPDNYYEINEQFFVKLYENREAVQSAYKKRETWYNFINHKVTSHNAQGKTTYNSGESSGFK